MKAFSQFLYNLILSLWIGGMVMLGLIVAPTLFSVLNRDAAGLAFGSILPQVFLYLAGLALAGLLLWSACMQPRSTKAYKATLGLLLLALVFSLALRYGIYPRMENIAQQLQSFEATPKDHPLRQEFGRLHGYTSVVSLLLLADGLALLGLWGFWQRKSS